MVPNCNNDFKWCPHEGYIPLDWDIKSAEEVCIKVTDGTHDTPKPTTDGVPYITAIHVKGGYIDFESSLFLPENVHSAIYKRCNPERGDLLVVNIGAGVAECGFVDVDFEFSLKNVALLKPNKERLYPDYLFQHHQFKKERIAHKVKSGGAQPFLSLKELRKLKLVLPPLPEQRKIAKILSTWDKAISTTEKLIETSKQQKKALMQQLLTGKKRLVNPETGKAFEGEWEEVKLKSITQFIKDGTHGTHKRYDNGVPMLSAANITKNHKVNFNGAPNISHDDYNKIHSKYEINAGDILLTVVGTLGRVALVPKEMKFTLQRSVAIIRTSNKASNQFLMQVFSSKEFNNLLMSKSNSTAQAGVYLGELAKIKLLLPSLEEQQKIASVLTAADKEIEVLEAKLAHFKQEKKALMQQLLTGKRRVKVDEEVAA
ncbi:TPA: restriction endonuclease subunit S [Vibrio vulnificus]